jgi:hypothetical protein
LCYDPAGGDPALRISVVLKFLAVLTFVVTLSMCIPLFYAVFRQEADVRAFAVSIGLGMTVAAAFYGLGRGGDLSRMGPREEILPSLRPEAASCDLVRSAVL